MYNCPGGVLLTAAPRCVGPECRGGPPGGGPTIGYAGDLDAGSRGAFIQAGRLIGLRAIDGVEVQKGLSAIDDLRREGAIDGYYASAAKRAYLERIEELPERAAPFAEVSAFGEPLAPGALSRRFKGMTGAAVGPSIREGCACTPREPDAQDPVSGWLIYYVEGGVLLTPTKKCVGGGGRRQSFWRNVWRNVLGQAPDAIAPAPPPSAPTPLVQPGIVEVGAAPLTPGAPAGPTTTPGDLACMVKAGAGIGGRTLIVMVPRYDWPRYLADGFSFC